MLVETVRSFSGIENQKYILEVKDLDYLSNEFNIVKDNLGIKLTSKKDPKLSISLGQFGIFYDRDISHLKLMIATQRVDVRIISILHNINETDWYQKYLPNTTDELIKLIDEFKYKPMGTVSEKDVIEFLQNNLVS